MSKSNRDFAPGRFDPIVSTTAGSDGVGSSSGGNAAPVLVTGMPLPQHEYHKHHQEQQQHLQQQQQHLQQQPQIQRQQQRKRARSQFRVSQRRPLSCIECSRRKIKCSMAIPCEACIKAGRTEKCVREMVVVTKALQSHRGYERNVLDELSVLQYMIEQFRDKKTVVDALEHRMEELASGARGSEFSLKPSRAIGGAGPSPSTGHGGTVPVSSAEDAEAYEADKTVTSIENVAWGRKPANSLRDFIAREDSKLGGSRGTGAPEISSDAWAAVVPYLPSRDVADTLVLFHLDWVAWQQNCLHNPTFYAECVSFWEKGRPPHGQICWLGLYFAVLSSAIHHLPLHELSKMYEPEVRDVLRRIWYNKSVSVLEDSEFMKDHSLYSVQAILTQTLVAYVLGESDRHTVMLATACRIAQCLGLHRAVRVKSTSAISFEDRVTAETQKRVWWQLVIQDWLTIHVSDTYLLRPDQFSVEMPSNCYDQDLIPLPLDVPTTSTYCILLAKIASLMPQLFEGLREANVAVRYEHILRIEQMLRALVDEFPQFVMKTASIKPEWPMWVPWARRLMMISAADKVMLIHRPFLIRALRTSEYPATREVCISAARTVLCEQVCGINADSQASWTIHAFSFSAAILLSLDLLLNPQRQGEQDKVHFRMIKDSINALSLQRGNMQAERGVYVLQHLVQEIENMWNRASGKSEEQVDKISQLKRVVGRIRSVGTVLDSTRQRQAAATGPTSKEEDTRNQDNLVNSMSPPLTGRLRSAPMAQSPLQSLRSVPDPSAGGLATVGLSPLSSRSVMSPSETGQEWLDELFDFNLTSGSVL